MHRNDKDREVRENFNVFIFPQQEFQFKDSDFCSNFLNNAFVLHCHSKFHHMSVMSQSPIKMTSMTQVNSFGVKMKMRELLNDI